MTMGRHGLAAAVLGFLWLACGDGSTPASRSGMPSSPVTPTTSTPATPATTPTTGTPTAPTGTGGTGALDPSTGAVAGTTGTVDTPTPGLGDAGDPAVDMQRPTLPPVDSVESDGPYAVTIDEGTGPDGSAWVARPTELGADGISHPIFLWGPGAGTTPSTYESYLRHWATHGFVVYSIVSTGDGSEMVAAIDWLEAENMQADSLYFGKLDTTKIAAGGHSRGSLSAFGAGDDPRLTTTIHVAGGSFDGNGPSGLHAPAAYLCGANDTLATPNCERDYTNTSVPVFFTVMSGIDHIMAAQGARPAVTAWLRWHLAGETERGALFLDPSCEFCSGTWVSQSKNW